MGRYIDFLVRFGAAIDEFELEIDKMIIDCKNVGLLSGDEIRRRRNGRHPAFLPYGPEGGRALV